MTNEEKIKQIEKWQHCDCLHPLTCGSDGCNHVVLKAVEKDNKVILVCPECDYKQEYIPNCVLNADVDKVQASYEYVISRMKGKE